VTGPSLPQRLSSSRPDSSRLPGERINRCFRYQSGDWHGVEWLIANEIPRHQGKRNPVLGIIVARPLDHKGRPSTAFGPEQAPGREVLGEHSLNPLPARFDWLQRIDDGRPPIESYLIQFQQRQEQASEYKIAQGTDAGV
jgi:hypothetical protein